MKHDSQNYEYDEISEGVPADRETVYEERRRVITDGCRKVNKTVSTSFAIENQNIVSSIDHMVYYCPITKIGSTFWKRVLTVMGSHGKHLSPFEISLGQVKLLKVKDFSETELKTLKETGTSFMFVRDPYARLFSGYENKIYHANLVYWKAIGRQVVRVVRNSDDDVYKIFGFDVTFLEFIKYILYLSESKKNIDAHFTPMVKSCDPCLTHFHYIGKMETFKDDADFLISKWQNEFENVTIKFGDFEKESILDTAKGRIRFLFDTKKILNEIKFPFVNIMLRTWRDLQMRGYISKHIEFPFKDTNVSEITKEDYIEAVKKALDAAVDYVAVKQQREEALIQFYSQVPLQDMERLRHYVLQDCLLFGYDDRPKKLFDRSKPLDGGFLYLDGLKK
ncbi:carbohydrate sulfotransferase 11-like [Mercenaria mercenaria]|uniref:carbohydrate sulfotransferase 11-like n=1 Tax=Mercenaria mercenaria TaxID=6596 RepID=UPI00234F750C|nr:carbohydrate sulfotransferase 11-like [Mercenaria mercenaria]